MSHWLDLRPHQLILEKVLHSEANQLVFSAHDHEESLYFYEAKQKDDEISVTRLHSTPLNQWGAPGQVVYFNQIMYQVVYHFDDNGLRTRVIGICSSDGNMQSITTTNEPELLLDLEGEYAMVFLDAFTLLAFSVDDKDFLAFGSGIPSVDSSIKTDTACTLQGLFPFSPIKKGGCFESWPLLAPRESVISASEGWAIWEEAFSEDYDRAERALSGETQPEEAIWSLKFWRDADTLIGERMPIAISKSNGWSRLIGVDSKGRLWFRTGEVLKDQMQNGDIVESLWSLSLDALELLQPIERYKRRAHTLTTAAYDSHMYVKTGVGYALYQMIRTDQTLSVKSLFGDTMELTFQTQSKHAHFEGKWANGYLFSDWHEDENTHNMIERLHHCERWPDAPWTITEGASATLSDDWCVLCLKSL